MAHHVGKIPVRIVAVVVLLVLLCGGDYRGFPAPSSTLSAPAAGDVELAAGWTLSSADKLGAGGRDGAAISTATYDDSAWVPVRRMPGTVLDILQSAGVYQNLYYGTNMLSVGELYKQDWWYRTTFSAPAGFSTYRLDFPGINYRADIWLNGHRIADNRQIVGMYVDHELDVTRWVNPGGPNTLAVKVTPERAIQDVDGVELADSWYDWINGRYLGYRGPGATASGKVPVSFVPDRNAGIFKPVHLRMSGPAAIGPSSVSTELPLPDTSTARLTVHSAVRNYSGDPVRGVLQAIISRPGRAAIRVAAPVRLEPGEQRDISFTPQDFSALTVSDPDLWWPYTLGRPDLYDLRLDFIQGRTVTATAALRFGIRTVTQGRDPDGGALPGGGGDFYLQVNGRDFPVRGATYAPDLLYRYDPERDAAVLHYARDLGLNMLRLESKIASARFVEMADEVGIPLMYGWMCCNQWERWSQWDDEDHRVAGESLRSQIEMLRSHPSVFIWANGSDGRPPEPVRAAYRTILDELHWPNAVVDTVSAFARDASGEPLWDGIQMAGPYSWRPPTYWFSGRYRAARGSSAEQGDNEHIPPFASLRRFIPPDKLWPINATWFFHAGAAPQNSTLTNVRRAIDRRYGASSSAQMFADKAQLAHYEATRAQFESFAAGGWDSHKMTIYWMLNSHWPSFFGNIFDYYLRPGGAYFGAKKGLRPVSVVFDSYATNPGQARVTVVNQSPEERRGLRVRVRVYDVAGRVRAERAAEGIDVAAGGAAPVLSLPPGPADSPVFFVRCELFDAAGRVAENVYWQSQRADDVGPAANDAAFDSKQVSWADMTALNTMAKTPIRVDARRDGDGVLISLSNQTPRIAFFARAELLENPDGDETLPVEYDDNYVTVFPGETVQIRARALSGDAVPGWVRTTGYNSAPVVVPVR
ncbi:MAG: glycosyl hydrolase 2 galactose-binding domain-containing protein [Mycobacterium sp.]